MENGEWRIESDEIEYIKSQMCTKAPLPEGEGLG
jgi:hypothetical protein